MRGVIIKTDEMPEEVELASDEHGSVLSSLQEAVGGHIEPFGVLFNDGIDLYINDGGLFTCPPNRAVYATKSMEDAGYLSQMDYSSQVKEGELYTILHGDIVAVGYDGDTGALRGLTDDEVKEVADYFTFQSTPGSGFIEQLLIKVGAYNKEREESLDEIAGIAMGVANTSVPHQYPPRVSSQDRGR